VFQSPVLLMLSSANAGGRAAQQHARNNRVRSHQAQGLDVLFASPRARCIAVSIDPERPEHMGFLVNLAASGQHLGLRVIIIDAVGGRIGAALGLRSRYELSHAIAGDVTFESACQRSAEGLQVLFAHRGLSMMLRQRERAARWFASLAGSGAQADLLLIAASPPELARLQTDHGATLVVVGALDQQGFAATYGRIKLLSRVYGVRMCLMVYHRVRDVLRAAACHDRLRGTVRSFLGAELGLIGLVTEDAVLDQAQRARASIYQSGQPSAARCTLEQLLGSVLGEGVSSGVMP
jgi:hypothetical protein